MKSSVLDNNICFLVFVNRDHNMGLTICSTELIVIGSNSDAIVSYSNVLGAIGNSWYGASESIVFSKLSFQFGANGGSGDNWIVASFEAFVDEDELCKVLTRSAKFSICFAIMKPAKTHLVTHDATGMFIDQ